MKQATQAGNAGGTSNKRNNHSVPTERTDHQSSDVRKQVLLGPNVYRYDEIMTEMWNPKSSIWRYWDQSKLTDFFATETRSQNEEIK